MVQAAIFNIKDRKRIQPLRKGKTQAASAPPAAPRKTTDLVSFESEIIDIAQMARVAVSVMESTLDSNRNLIDGNREYYWIPDEHREMAVFTVVHLQQMIDKLEARIAGTVDAEDTPQC